MKRRTEITIETDRLLVLRHHRRAHAEAKCAACGAETPMVTVDEAAAMSRTSSRAIYRLVEAEQLHFTETSEGRLFICPNSL